MSFIVRCQTGHRFRRRRSERLLTTRNADGQIEGVKYAQITTVLVNSVKEQQKIIEQQQVQITALKKLVCTQNPTAEICGEKQ